MLFRSSDLQKTLEANLKNDGAGRVSRDGESFLVKIQTASTNIEEIKSIPIITKFGYVRLRNFCDVIESHMTRLGLTTIDGKGETTLGLVLSLKGANSRDAIAEIKVKLEELKAELPQGTELRVLKTVDPAAFVIVSETYDVFGRGFKEIY